jgi:hypothetical protein
VHQQHGRDAGEVACGVALLAGKIHGSGAEGARR